MVTRGDDIQYLCPTLEIQSITLYIDSIITGTRPSLALAVSLEDSTSSPNLDYHIRWRGRSSSESTCLSKVWRNNPFDHPVYSLWDAKEWLRALQGSNALSELVQGLLLLSLWSHLIQFRWVKWVGLCLRTIHHCAVEAKDWRNSVTSPSMAS